ncbi:AIPR family protein [Corynebacterium variabile]|uniref:AIPR family protein n=1 Tax=Corynebacterium variabile TaxID=1727 RepID=UPI003FCF2BEB
MDMLLRRRTKKFAQEMGFQGSDAELFELFTASVYLSRYIEGQAQLIEQCVIGGGEDGGIDIAAVIVNGSIVTSVDSVEEEIAERNDNTVKVVFIQTKTSESFDSKLISKFLFGVKQVGAHAVNFDDGSLPELDGGLVEVVNILDFIVERLGSEFTTTKIPCELYYVTTSKNDGQDARNQAQVINALAEIEELGVYEEGIVLRTQGNKEFDHKQLESKGPQNIQFLFEKKQSIPSVEDIEQAYIGIIQARELLNLLADEEGIRPGIFDDNVRLYQGDGNVVNRKIYSTLASVDRRMFPFLNNGLTIIARKLSNVGDKFTASGYQVVNGGQTSNQIVRWALSLGSQFEHSAEEYNSTWEEMLSAVWVPLKLISTNSPEVLSEVTVATNLQTSIAATDIQSSSRAAKVVEEYFENSGDDGLRYARQSGGDIGRTSFPRLRIVSTPDLNRDVASCIFGESSRAIGSPNELASEDSFIWEDHPASIYYFAAYVVYRIERYLSARTVDKDMRLLRAAKYHIAMMASVLCFPEIRDIHLADRRSPTVRKKIDRLGKKLDRKSSWEESIEEHIDNAFWIAHGYFAYNIEEGKALRKDDVRSRRAQDALLRLAVEED